VAGTAGEKRDFYHRCGRENHRGVRSSGFAPIVRVIV